MQRLLDVGVLEVAVVYDALQRVCGIGPRTADDLLIWEVAVMLGVHRPDPEQADDNIPTPDPQAHGRDLLRQRLAHSKGEGPAPQVRPVSSDQLQTISEAMA